VDRRGVLTYQAPQFKGNDALNLTFTALFDDSRDVRTFNARREEGTAQLTHRLTKANTIQYRLGYRRVTVDPNSLKITPALIPLLSQPVQLGLASLTFIQDRRDDGADPHKGIYNTLDVALASNFFGSKTSFTRALGRNATYHHIKFGRVKLGRDVILARETSFGVISRLGSQDVPLPERFFAGGASSHRGFAENQAGPRDPETGFPIGGKALLMNIVELRFPLLGDNIGGVVFHDSGNVYSSLNKLSFRTSQRNITDFDYMVHALGFGIRYRTPIGPIRVDLGYAINPPEFIGFKGTREQLFVPVIDPALRVRQQLSHFQFHFSLGQAF
jgi:outer membrane protein assembly factor BamA